MSTPSRAPGAGWPAAERALGLWRDWNGRKEGAGAPRLPASGIGTQCQRSAGVPSNPARRWSGEGRAPLTLASLPGFPAFVTSCLWPDISRERMEKGIQ